MPRKTPTSLPEPLRYLLPFVRSLAKLSRDGLNEDIDASRLEAALCKRLRGCDAETAQTELSKDRELLKTWLNATASPEHPAYWVLGYLNSPDIARQLVRPNEPPPRGPKISFEPPLGWKVKVVPFALNLKKGKLIGSIVAMEEQSFGILQRQKELGIANWNAPPRVQGSWNITQMASGQVSGKKYLYHQTAPVHMKGVEYLLAVPGGFVCVTLGAIAAKEFAQDFDESLFEAQAHTLRVSAQA